MSSTVYHKFIIALRPDPDENLTKEVVLMKQVEIENVIKEKIFSSRN